MSINWNPTDERALKRWLVVPSTRTDPVRRAYAIEHYAARPRGNLSVVWILCICLLAVVTLSGLAR